MGNYAPVFGSSKFIKYLMKQSASANTQVLLSGTHNSVAQV